MAMMQPDEHRSRKMMVPEEYGIYWLYVATRIKGLLRQQQQARRLGRTASMKRKKGLK